MDNIKNNKKIKVLVQFTLGLLCGYLILMTYESFIQKNTQDNEKPPVLETVVGY